MLNAEKFYQLSEPVDRRWPKMSKWVYLLIILIVAFVIMMGSGMIGLIIDAIATGNFSAEAPSGVSSGGFTRTLIAGFLPIFFLTYLALKFFERRGLRSVGMQRENALRNYVRGLLIGLALFGSVVLIMWLLGYAEIENPFSSVSVAGAFLVLIGWIVQGAAEEVVVRGFLLQIFGRMTNTTIAIVVSSIFFALVHGANPGIGLIPLANLIMVSLFFSVYVLYEGSLWGAFGAHSVWNWAQGNLFGFEVSGNIVESAIVLDLMETGPDSITGGLYGPEGGLIVTIVLLIGTGLMYYIGNRRTA